MQKNDLDAAEFKILLKRADKMLQSENLPVCVSRTHLKAKTSQRSQISWFTWCIDNVCILQNSFRNFL